jgi:hypothetical protein
VILKPKVDGGREALTPLRVGLAPGLKPGRPYTGPYKWIFADRSGRRAKKKPGAALSSTNSTARHVFVKPSEPISCGSRGQNPALATRFASARPLYETQPRPGIIQYFFCADLRVVLDRRLRSRWA